MNRPRRIYPTSRLYPSEKKLLAWGDRNRRRDGVYGIALEGDKLVNEALLANHPLEAVWYTDVFAVKNPAMLSALQETGCFARQVNSQAMKTLSALATPPGIVAVAPQPNLIHHHPGDPFSLITALAPVQDPGNLGGVIRTADYFGADEVWLGPGSADPFSRKSIRGSMGAIFRMPVRRVDDLAGEIRRFSGAGAECWAAVVHDADAVSRIDPQGARILLIGGESRGLHRELMELAHRKIRIPGAQRGESLNLAVAAGVLIYMATVERWRVND